ncbi:MAG: PD-(D/E)XK nuclease family protein [Bacteroidota bacterium]
MNTFLQQIIDQLKQEYAGDISELCLIVPTRRAVVFLREALAKAYRQTIWAPRMMSIQDFVREQFDWQFPEVLPLVFELYSVYMDRMRQEEPDWYEPFERFYAWGEMLVKDFDEVDKYCVDAEQLFTNVKDLKEIELFFNLPEGEEYQQALQRFWNTIRANDTGPTETQEKFLKIWQTLYDVYTGFKSALQDKGVGYDGMAYRRIVDKLSEDSSYLNGAYKKIVFVGFNALSKAEETIMASLLAEKQAIVYWDVDWAYYTPPGERPHREAHLTGEEPAKFIQEYHKKWRNKDWDSRLILHDMRQTPKAIYHTGVPLQVGQAQYLGNLLREEEPETLKNRETAIVLADENLLFPVLYAIPSAIDRLNITMGFPLRQTHIYTLLMVITRMLRNLRWHGDQVAFSHREVEDILNNPYIKAENAAASERILKEVRRQNLIFVPRQGLLQFGLGPLLQHLFTPPSVNADTPIQDLGVLHQYFDAIFQHLLEDARERKAVLEAEYIYHFHTQFNQLRDILDQYPLPLRLRGFVNLFREVMQRVRIPFEGEPLEGLQIMGFLETRVLDFKKIYILGANEGNLPDTSSGNSFIPYNLRKAFGLPTFEEKDAIYAYHFYRLLQRTEEIHLIYNTVVNDSSGGGSKELSRFIRQIRHFFPRQHEMLRIQERIVSTPSTYGDSPVISVANDRTIRELLHHRYISEESKTYFSATALNTYLGCPLRFYFRYVAGIEEPEEVEETMEANTFGSVLHETLEFVYEGYEGKLIGPEEQEILKKRLKPSLEKALEKNKLGKSTDLQGQNYLLRNVIEQLCLRILKHDLTGKPFELLSREDKKSYRTRFDTGRYHVRFNGTFDRIDKMVEENIVRILDYKTGRVELGSSNLELDSLFVDNKYKEAFQGFLYAWLYLRQQPGARVKVGYYTARQLKDGIQYLLGGQILAEEILHQFERHLAELINQIFEADFVQTEDEKKCRICPYREICNR